ncbi:exocyst complex component EXO70E2-like [Magnolia sinica]|uniref:exocyst complex component EXO70E2-like n=1 Tax=Magnolia sinica TaxID=86752 RepID=UPI00265A0C8A|nr:exocyst complex component EXO70E2-like [Magnolia sinica]XP_058070455.1 exocyst complex component EXO70E2-like [Magnolia sinica]XP_058070456.1 exocyst complex component EXO70E2-like [Magnolia sinica]
MAESKDISDLEGDERVLAVAQHIVKTLGTSKNPTDDMIRLLSEFDIRLSASRMTEILEKKGGRSDVKEQLNLAEKKIMSWVSDESMIWDCGPDEASEYLLAVDEVRRLTENLGSLSLSEGQEESELLRRAHSVLQTGMARLEEEFSHILIQNRQPFEPEHMSFRSSEDGVADEDSISSFDDEQVEDSQAKLQRDSSKGSEEFIIDLIHPEVIPDLKCIAEVMFMSNYDQECCQAYSSIRKDALDECLFILEVEKLSIEEVLKMEWSYLDSKIKKWIRAMKIFIRVYLASEKRLCDQIFGEFGSVIQTCFNETSKGSILQLLIFSEAIAISPCSPEKLFRILDMYEGLADLLPDIDTLFSEEAGSCVRMECHEVLRRLGDCVRGTIVEFENAVRTKTSTTPFAGGGIHHLTRYVMNYIRALTDYSDTLNILLEGHDDEDESSSLFNSNNSIEEDSEGMSCNISPVARCLRSVTSTLECNLDGKSMLYKDGSLQFFFLMNNIYYMVQKVKDSDLRALLGDDWIRRHNRKFRQHALSYERASWTSILSFLKDEGISNPGSSSVFKAVLKERFRSFNLAFEEIYKTQTAWLIPDPQLRDDLRISISLKILQAYRTFTGRYSPHLEGGRHGDKYIKYTAEDLQNYLLDLFEGSPRSLHNPRRK